MDEKKLTHVEQVIAGHLLWREKGIEKYIFKEDTDNEDLHQARKRNSMNH